MSRLAGKHFVITGASSGLGKELAHEVAKCGGHVSLLARSSEKIKELSEKISSTYGVKSAYYELDVSDEKAVRSVFSTIYSEWQTIDCLINNAGFGLFERAIDANFAETKEMFEVNVLGVISCTQAVLPRMLKENSGQIVNIGSQAGKIATPKSSAYCATKYALIGYSNSLRLELNKTNVAVTVINPGPMKTDFLTIADPSGNYVKNAGKYMLSARDVAKKTVIAIEKRKRELNLPLWMNIASKVYALFPSLFERLARRSFELK
ncbi:oxidoreductase [Lottiidibacillus patelloidae]|uniref:Oxidoreductase n=1 Tax=Lottiidibacillus patelloidae TaxID=2670334 RepID=A0A263BZV3_9BACI|nr:SDR family oxidoreductase [Lottiidibacillus patelloidae]OZM58676.1 oxidoreductase [Lottiidibacillus patelloidae]